MTSITSTYNSNGFLALCEARELFAQQSWSKPVNGMGLLDLFKNIPEHKKWWVVAYNWLGVTVRESPYFFAGLWEFENAPGQTKEGILEAFDATIQRVDRSSVKA